MATTNFHARIERIQKAHANATAPTTKPVREGGVASVTEAMQKQKRRSPVRDHLMSIVFGVMLGGLAAVLHVGLGMEGSPWGPGTTLHSVLQYPTLVGLALAPLLMLVSVFAAAKRPAFALFSLGYITGAMIPLML